MSNWYGYAIKPRAAAGIEIDIKRYQEVEQMNKIFISMGLSWAAKKMDGKKTYFGGAVLMLLGAGEIIVGMAGIIGNMYPDLRAPVMDIDTCSSAMTEGLGMIGAGLAAIGIGHKVVKTSEPPI